MWAGMGMLNYPPAQSFRKPKSSRVGHSVIPVVQPKYVPAGQSPLVAIVSAILVIGGASPAEAKGPPNLQARLEEYSLYQSLFGSPNSPTQKLFVRVQAVQEVLQRASLLARLHEYDAARALLRGREVSLLALDLGYAAEAYRVLPQQSGRRVLATLEAACAALGSEDTLEEVMARLGSSEAALRAVADVLEAAAD